VGDDLQTDIQGAQNANMNACLVKTGKYAARPPEIIPQGVRVIETLSELLESE
jgi:ribonucleotide monophosphatase NagD (HAD superfamily)